METEGMMNASRSSHRIIAACLLTGLLLGCDDRSTGPDAEDVAVFSVEPEEATQGETAEVRVRGSGFRPDDVLVWERDGQPDPNIEVTSLFWLSEGEFMARLNVGPEAVAASYDVTVTDRLRVRGIGTELFNVLHGIGAELTASFSFDYDGHRTGSFSVDTTFILHPDSMWTNSGEWALTLFLFNYGEQYLGAQMAREDGLVDFIDCYSPGGKVREPSTRPLECWMELGADIESHDWVYEDAYMTSVAGDRPGDGSGQLTFTQVSPQRLVGEFSITMHQYPDFEGDKETLQITNGSFDLAVLSQYWNQQEPDPDPDDAIYRTSGAAINDEGLIAGTVTTIDTISRQGFQRAVRWSVDADGNVDGPHELASSNSWVTDVNNAGLIVGNGPDEDTQMSERPFIYDGVLRWLAVPTGAEGARALGVNDAGAVVGYVYFRSVNAPSTHRPLLWPNPLDAAEQPIELPSLEGHDWTERSPIFMSFLINNDGVIVGDSWGAHGAESVFWQLESDGTVTGPWVLEGARFNRTAWNDNLDLVGMLEDQGRLLRNGVHIPLSPLPGHGKSNAWGMSNPSAGEPLRVVGTSWGFSEPSTPVLWTVHADGTVEGPFELELPDTYIGGGAWGINTHGWIVGASRRPEPQHTQGWMTGTIWIPRPDSEDNGFEIVTLPPTVAEGGAVAGREADIQQCRLHPLLSKSPRCKRGQR